MIEFLLTTELSAVIASHFVAAAEIHSPHLIDLEVAQVLRRYVRTNTISLARAQQALDDFADMRLVRYPHTFFIARIWQLRHTLTAYDAAYVALAEALNAPLVTCDRTLASSSGHRARVLIF